MSTRTFTVTDADLPGMTVTRRVLKVTEAGRLWGVASLDRVKVTGVRPWLVNVIRL